MINYGDKARLGVLVPSGNSVAEIELRAMIPADVAVLVTRLALRGSSEPELLAMLEDLDKAAVLMGHPEPDAIAFHCTAVSTFAPHLAGEIRSRITAATGRLAIATADAILAAFKALRTRKVLLVTPYIEPVHRREVDYLLANGVEITGSSFMGVNTNLEMAKIHPQAITDQVVRSAQDCAADTCFVSCTAIRSAGLITRLEETLGMPVITSNQVMAWYALTQLGVSQRVPGYGRLMDN